MRGIWPQYKWHILTVGVSLISAACVVTAILEIAGIKWGVAWPWILLGVGGLLALLALVVQSYAPPGPNFVERALNVRLEPILIVIGAGFTLLGTIFWFDLENDELTGPTLWWLGVIALGVLLLIIGVLRIVAAPDDAVADPTMEAIRALAKRTERTSGEATKIKTAANGLDPTPGQAALDTINQIADNAVAEEAGADVLRDEAEGIYTELVDLRSRIEERALNAESDLKVLKGRFDVARTRSDLRARQARQERAVEPESIEQKR